VVVLSVVLGAATVALMPHSHTVLTPASLPVHLAWWLLIPVFFLAALVPVVYEVRGEAHHFTFTQLAIGVGLVFVEPRLLLAAALIASALHLCLVVRPTPVKALFNFALGGLEVAVAAAVASAFEAVQEPGPRLWLALFCALLISDLVAAAAMQLLFIALGVGRGDDSSWRSLVGVVASTAVFTGVAIVIVAAVWTDAWTAAIGAGVAGGLSLVYRQHRRLAADQQKTAELHQFIKGLGPLDLDDASSHPVLSQARTLLYARHLDVLLQTGDGWRRYGDRENEADEAELEIPATPTFAPELGQDDHMSAPLVGATGMIGVLRVSSRLGHARPFGPRDLRLLETLATELSTAIERGRLHRDLAVAATTDPLTRLPNLHETSVRLDSLLARHREGVLVAAIAVDSFREINDTLGHQVGDDLLHEVTRRLELSHPEALIGRIGGGRFAVAVPAATVGHDLSMFGLGLRAQVEGGAQLGPIGTHIKLAVGCARGPEHGGEAATLLRRAETAMYSARHASGGPVVWEPAYEVEGQRRLAVVMALREALASGAIGVGFQPKVDTLTRAVTGVEALARWTHPALGSIAPSEFVPLAEASGLMGPLTATVLRQALTTCRGWQRRGGRVGVAVNVSAETILDPSFVTEVAAILTSVGIAPDLLTIELTEGVVVNDPALAAERLGELRALGVKISVDDFGTGYSSLTYLKGLPVDEVKIDKAFVDGIVHDLADGAVVRAVVDIAHTLGLRVVAEGVEQEEQHQMLARFGVDEVQGYLHARPMAALDMAQWLRRREQGAGLPDL
jgi:diguanylate cyclase (GGDEF)-like protein